MIANTKGRIKNASQWELGRMFSTSQWEELKNATQWEECFPVGRMLPSGKSGFIHDFLLLLTYN